MRPGLPGFTVGVTSHTSAVSGGATVRYSITMVATDLTLPIVDLARAVEDRGLDGIWLPDHTHIPVSRSSPYPLGGELPEQYKRMVEPLVALAMAGAVTHRIRLGTGIMLAAQRDPIVSSKALATIDQQSGGRVVVGVGYGWNTDEMASHGVDPATRRAKTREHVLAMRRFWEDDVASFEGAHVEVAPSWSWPKPQQRPLPVLMGGAPGPVLFDQIAEFAQGWIPLGGRGLAEAIPRLRERVAATGRDPAALEIVPFIGSETHHGKMDSLQHAGVTEVAFHLPSLGSTEVLRTLDGLAEFVAHRRL
jgi:probable F420-dependent oxidoreductase